MIVNNTTIQSRSWDDYQRLNLVSPGHGQLKPTIQNISHTIHRRFTTIIPSTNKVLIDTIEPFLKERNVYACLWSLMRRTCGYMKPEPEGWGPSWPSNVTPEQYVVRLQQHCCVTNRKNTKDIYQIPTVKRNALSGSLYVQPTNCNKTGQ